MRKTLLDWAKTFSPQFGRRRAANQAISKGRHRSKGKHSEKARPRLSLRRSIPNSGKQDLRRGRHASAPKAGGIGKTECAIEQPEENAGWRRPLICEVCDLPPTEEQELQLLPDLFDPLNKTAAKALGEEKRRAPIHAGSNELQPG
jgi:hypothetical protein